MARETYEDWLPTEVGSQPIQALVEDSAVEQWARPEPMIGDVKQIPRVGNFAVGVVAKGAAYNETSGVNDVVEMIARKIGGISTFAEEDLLNAPQNIVTAKETEAARSLALFFDNAALGVSAAANGTTVPFTSVYKTVRTADASVSYTADANYVATSAGAAVSYANLSKVVGLYEEGNWSDPANTVIIASHAFRTILRDTLDGNGRPIFEASFNGGPPSVFGYPVHFSRGAVKTATASYQPAGNPLFIIANRNLLVKGMARLTPNIVSTNPGFDLVRARGGGPGWRTDEASMKATMKRAFILTHPAAAAVLERIPAA